MLEFKAAHPQIEGLQHLQVSLMLCSDILLQLLSVCFHSGQPVAVPGHAVIEVLPFLREAAQLTEEESSQHQDVILLALTQRQSTLKEEP